MFLTSSKPSHYFMKPNISVPQERIMSLVMLSLLWMLMVCSPANAIAQFEGIIDMKVSTVSDDSARATTYRMYVQKDKLAATVEGSGTEMQRGSFIFRGDRKLLWIVNDDQKNYMEISTKEQESNKATKKNHEQASSPGLQKTGNTKKILGYTCEELLVTEDEEEIRIWATTKLGNVYEGLAKSFGELGGKHMNEETGWEQQLAAMKMFPLKLTTMRNGITTETQEVTNIETKKLASSAFEPPKGYKKESIEFDMEKLMKQMQEEMKKQSKDADSSERQD